MEQILFADNLSGPENKGWVIPPQVFVDHPQFGRVFLLDWQRRGEGFPLVGDESWRNYRLEVEVLPVSRGGYLGINFHVQPDLSGACNIHFPVLESGRNEAFQSMGIWGKSCAWKLYPESQGYALFPAGGWIPLSLDITETSAILYLQKSASPILILHDLPFRCGGVQFWSFLGSGCFRNLRIENLVSTRLLAGFDNPWRIYEDLAILRKWQVTPPQKSNFGLTGIPDNLAASKMKWLEVESDLRGVVNLSALFPGNNTKACVFAKTTILSPQKEKRILRFTYTDRFTLWGNGKLIFTGPPRGWEDADREKHFGGRLIPDEFAAKITLNPGENIIIIRSEVTEPWGWGFWMRID